MIDKHPSAYSVFHFQRASKISVASLMLMLLSGCGKIQPEQHAMNLFDKGEFVESIRTADAIIEKSLDKDIVYDMQVLKGRSLINLAIYDRESGNEDAATTKLEQALLVLTSAIEFRDDDPIPLYHRATVHDLLGNEMAGYKDSLAAKEIDPEHRTAYTNEIVHRDLEAEADQRYEAHKRVVDAKFVRPEFDEESDKEDSQDAPRDELAELEQNPYGQNRPYDGPRDVNPHSRTEDHVNADRKNRSKWLRNGEDVDDGTHDDDREEDQNNPNRRFADDSDEPANDGEAGGTYSPLPDADSPVLPNRRIVARDTGNAQPPSDTRPKRNGNPFNPRIQFNDSPTGGSPGVPYAPAPSTGVTGDVSRFRPDFRPELPTTGYTERPGTGQQQGFPNAGIPNAGIPSTGVPNGLGGGPTLPTTGYSGRTRSNLPNAMPRLNSNRAFLGPLSPDRPTGGLDYTGALPFSERVQFGQPANPLTVPYQAPPTRNDPYSNVPRAPTMRDFYQPPTLGPAPVPTTSIYGQ